MGETRPRTPAHPFDKSGSDYDGYFASHLCGYTYVLGQPDLHGRELDQRETLGAWLRVSACVGVVCPSVPGLLHFAIGGGQKLRYDHL
jgi:hypothetical protein